MDIDMERAGLYARISRDATGQRAGVERQERECRELAQRQGWTVAGVYCDNDISAYSGKPRPEYRRLLGTLKERAIDAVVVWHADRLYRNVADLEELVTIAEKAGAPIATVTAGHIDLTTPAGRAVARTLGAWGRYEGEQKAERHRSKDRQMAQNGQHHGGPRTYGYAFPGVDDPAKKGQPPDIVREEAEVVRELAERILGGEALHQITRSLNERGIPTARGGRWHHQTINRLMRSPMLAGLRVYQGQVAGRGNWTPILTIDQHRALDALLSDPSRLTSRSPRRYLLTGIARCGLCGAGLMARPKWDQRRNYLCRECGKIGVLADPLEELVVEVVLQAVESPAFDAQLRASQPTAAGGEVEAQLQELAELWASREITRGEWLAARAPLQRQLDAQRRSEAQRARSHALDGYQGDALRAAWPKLDLGRRRAVLQAVIESVTVGPALRGRNRFDPSRINILWRA